MILLGDTHGNWGHIFWAIKQKGLTNTTIYHVGDIGVGFSSYEYEMKQLQLHNEKFKKYGIMFYGIRGNHDNPHFFDGSIDMSNLKLLPDYTLINIEGKGILGVGGATSIDRVPRISENETNIKRGSDKRCWWPGEKFLLDEEELGKLGPGTVDIVVTHTAPSFCYPRSDNGFAPIVNSYAENDGKLKTELLIERGGLKQMYEILNNNQAITHHFYGHFHTHEVTLEGMTEFICLDINQLYELKDYRGYEEMLNKKYGE